jgi:tetratricopeptide (TPR) repeat protein
VTRAVPDRGAFVDFERLARLQRLMVEARDLAGAMEFREDTEPQFRRIEPEGLRLLFEAGTLQKEEQWQAAVDTLRRADALQRDREAHHFLGRVAGLEAWCLGGLGRLAEAESTARRSLVIAPENADGHLTLAAIYNGRNEWPQSLAQLDTLESWYPNYEAATVMRQNVMAHMQGVTSTAPPSVLR